MSTTMFGWTGKILTVDLTEQKISTLATEAYSERFIGGLGIGQKIYWDKASPGVAAFDPANPLILMTGPLGATPAPSAPRLVVCGKSPCVFPETFVNASMGGFFAAELKKAGYDGLVVQGKAEQPVYISITDDRVALKDARTLWGLTNGKTRQAVQAAFDGTPRILSIGPGAENGTRIGTIFTDVGGSASMGFGSVMGSKNLKAIAVRGSGTVAVADPAKVKAIRKKFQAMKGRGYYSVGGTTITLPGTEVVKKVYCHGCPQGCSRTLQRGPGGHEGIRKCQIGIFYSRWDQKLHGQPTEAGFNAATIANEYSLCVMELVFLLLWLEKCLARGILSEKEIELPFAKAGSLEFFETLVKKISSKEGFGAVLAEGTIRAAATAGKESGDIARTFLTQTGRAIAYGPKVFIPSALIYAVEPRPSITELHEISGLLTKWAIWYKTKGAASYVSTDVLRNITEKFWGSKKAADFSTYEGKALAAVNIQNRQFAKESLVLCDFAWPVYDDASTEDHVGDPSLESRLLSAVTGRGIDAEAYNQMAARIFTMNRAILLKEGRRGRADDYLPEFCFIEREEPIADGFGMQNPELLLPAAGDTTISRKGKAVDQHKFEQLRDEYYRLRGWDPETGIPKKETLQRLQLDEIVQDYQTLQTG